MIRFHNLQLANDIGNVLVCEEAWHLYKHPNVWLQEPELEKSFNVGTSRVCNSEQHKDGLQTKSARLIGWEHSFGDTMGGSAISMNGGTKCSVAESFGTHDGWTSNH